MARWTPDPTFYPSPKMAMSAPRERFAYSVGINVDNGRPDALVVVDLDPQSPDYGTIVHRIDMPYVGDELHHFGWNACSSALCPYAPHPHLSRRYLIAPGLRSSRIYVFDTEPDPRKPKLVKTIEPEEIMAKTGYSRPHTVHCGPDAIYVNAMGGTTSSNGHVTNGSTGAGGIFLLDHFNFDVIGPWEIDRGDQELHYDFWWHIAHDVMVSSEWGKPHQFEGGVVPEELLAGKYGHQLHFWDLRKRRKEQSVDLGADQQMVLELRPAHDPRKTYGFAGVVISLADLSANIWTWYREDGQWKAKKTITIPAQPASEDELPPLLKGFKAVPPLVTDIDLSLDDRYLYVSCWGTGELHQYDVSDPFNPQLTGKIEIGGIARRKGHPRHEGPLLGGPQMVEVSRDGRRVYLTNGLYSTWDDQFYPDGLKGWMVVANANIGDGGMALDPDFFIYTDELRLHQVRLEGGDASTDSFCYPS